MDQDHEQDQAANVDQPRQDGEAEGQKAVGEEHKAE